MEHSAEIFKPAEAGTVSLRGTSIARTYWLRAEVVLLCYHSLACPSCFLTRAEVCTASASVSPQAGVWRCVQRKVCGVSMPVRILSMSQGCSCLVVLVYESCAVISASPLGSFRTMSMDPTEMVSSPTSTVDNNSSPPKRQVKEK